MCEAGENNSCDDIFAVKNYIIGGVFCGEAGAECVGGFVPKGGIGEACGYHCVEALP